MTPILEMRGITKTFPGVKALDNVNLSVMPGEIHALVGESGAGKSTLMKVLPGVYPHGSFDGEIFYDGKPARFGGIHDSEARGIIIGAVIGAFIMGVMNNGMSILGSASTINRSSRGWCCWQR